ncbi:MAG: FHA domain-containing protein [Bradymonadales bacterium]|nr:MAG: FHA domain-containing protein [Bradymonadales bacterium]
MLSLCLFSENVKILSLPLKKEVYRLGRSADCDVVLHDELVSREHLCLRKKSGQWTVEDLSRNGLFVGKKKLPNHLQALELNTRYEMGARFSFELQDLELPSKTLLSSGSLTELVVLGRDEASLRVQNAQLMPEGGSAATPISIGREGLSIGRHPSNDLVLTDPAVSLFHARIVIENNSFFFSDLQSTNGSFIDGLKVHRAVLRGNHEIRISSQSFRFEIQENRMKIQRRQRTRFFEILSSDSQMQALFDLAETVAPTDAPVFLSGETGTGKELFAKAIHQLSSRSFKPMISLNCAALPSELAESELFGHEKGAFTGAQALRRGAFERAENSSLFLDEVADLDLKLQAKLLRVLETGDYYRIGAEEPRISQVRIIAASHKNLEEEVAEGRFREDLYFRLKIIPFDIPPLRDRPQDIRLISEEILPKLSWTDGVDEEVLEFLTRLPLFGNVRELKNHLMRAIVQRKARSRSSGPLELEDFRFLTMAAIGQRGRDPEENKKRREIEKALKDNHFNQSRTARALKLPVSTLHDRMKRYGISAKA